MSNFDELRTGESREGSRRRQMPLVSETSNVDRREVYLPGHRANAGLAQFAANGMPLNGGNKIGTFETVLEFTPEQNEGCIREQITSE